MTTDEDRAAKADRFLERVDKRRARKIQLRKIPSTVRLTADLWDTIDRNRIPMGMTRSSYISYAVYTIARKYDQARAMRRREGEVLDENLREG